MEIAVLAETRDYIAVDKPCGLLVHRTRLASREKSSCLGLLEASRGEKLYPVHRLDRATSGVLLLARSAQAAAALAEQWRLRAVEKIYFALVRGWLPSQGEICKPILNERGEPQEARTLYRLAAAVEVPQAIGPHPTTRYCLAELRPSTGRWHQLRKHMAGASHPIIGDTIYGDGKHNRFFREQYGTRRLWLFAREIGLPVDSNRAAPVRITAPWPKEFAERFKEWNWPVEQIEPF